MLIKSKIERRPEVLIVGGGFAGLNVAQGLKNAPVSVMLIDKHNYHLMCDTLKD